jgi:hypothetical protein
MEPDTSEILVQLVDNIQASGLENTLQLFYGIYKAEVTSNEDPEERGRILARNVDIGQQLALEIWVPPLFDMAGNKKGFFFPPEKGDFVRIFYHMGDVSQPYGYLGGWFGTEDKADEFVYTNARPEKRGIITRMGSGILFSDEADNQYVRLVWHQPAPGDAALSDAAVTADRAGGKFSFMELTKDGSIQGFTHEGHGFSFDNTDSSILILHKEGHSISITDDGINLTDKDGNIVNLDKGKFNVIVDGNMNFTGKDVNFSIGGIALGGPQAVLSVPLGEPLLAWLASHTHLSAAPMSPTGPPLVPPTPALLSKTVKLK